MNTNKGKLEKTNNIFTIILKILAIITLLIFLCICAYKYVYLPFRTAKEEKLAEEEASEEKARLIEEANKTAKTTPALTVFLDYDIYIDRINEIGQEIQQNPEVSKVVFVSAEQAWAKFKEENHFEEDTDTFSDDNPLDSYYEVYVNDVTKIDELVDFIADIDGVRGMNKSGVLSDY